MTTKRAELDRMLRTYVLDSNNPDLRAYWGRDDVPLDSLIRDKEFILRMGGMRQARVLDIGCGFGWDDVLLSVLGDNTIVANDIRSTMIDVVNERLDELRRQGFDLPITPILGDVCELSLPEQSFDAIHSSEAIEHVHDLPKMFEVVRKLLRPGGKGVFLNDSNALHPSTREHTTRMWVERDTSQDFIDELKRERPIENAEIEPYAVMRRRVIKEASPELAEESVAAIARATAGMTAREIRAFLADYHPGDRLPEPPAISWCRNPITEE
jgi:ubiquinone/menaquinone biosynthesis C-methylase UbiE